MINDILVTDEVVEEQFMCNLNACKGACCWEGDFGAPLEKAELDILEHIYDQIKSFLTAKGRAVIEEEGAYVYYTEPKEYGTPLVENAACAYMTYSELGIAQCGIENAFRAGLTDFRKPVSCQLYPIRVKENPHSGLKVLEYDRWDICSAACTRGEQEKMPVYLFVKEALIRKYGEEFFSALEGAI